jgi:hypothetical protein
VNVRASATYLSCAGLTTSVNIKYNWTLFKGTDSTRGVVAGVTSMSKNPSIFNVPSFTLSPASYYLTVRATRPDNNEISTAATVISVVSAGVSAVIAFGSAQSLSVGSHLVLDASSSTNNDLSVNQYVGLGFNWTCLQVSPVYGSNCGIGMSGVYSSMVTLTAATTLIGNVLRMSVTVSTDATSSTASVDVTVVPSRSPTVALSTTADTSHFLASSMLTIIGSISTPIDSCGANWKVKNASSLTIADITYSATSAVVAASTTDYALSLSILANVLPTRTTVTFSLSCGVSTSSLEVTVNGPPFGGAFSVSPRSGTGLSTLFTLAASSWFDEDLPLAYQFLFVSPTVHGTQLVLRSAVQSTSASMMLPSGSAENGYALTCVMNVFDYYQAYTTDTAVVTVNAFDISSYASLAQQLQDSISSASSDVEGTTLSVNLVSTTLNRNACNGTATCSSSELAARLSMRETMLNGLQAVSQAGVTDTASLSATVSSLSSAAYASYELSAASVNSIFSVTQSLLSTATSMTIAASTGTTIVSSSMATSLYAALNSAAVGSGLVLPNSSDAAISLVELVGTCNALVASSVAAGQDPIVAELDSFSSVTANMLLNDSSSEFSLNVGPNVGISIPSNGASTLLVQSVVTASWAYGSNNSQLQSNPVSVTVASVEDIDVVMYIQKDRATLSETISSNVTYTERCSFGEFRSVNHTCPNSAVMVTLRCMGAEETVRGSCPGIREETTCESAVSGGSVNCVAVAYSATNVTCKCSLKGSSSGSSLSRRLSSNTGTQLSLLADQTGVTHVAAMSAYVGEEFAGTWSSAEDINSIADLRHALIVITAVCVLWVGGFMLIVVSAARSKMNDKHHKKQEAALQRRKKTAHDSKSPSAIQEYLMHYVEEVFPVAFRDAPRFDRVYAELKRHHRYFLMLTCTSDASTDRDRIISGVRLLTVQTMLMFLLAVFYDLQAPADDGSCQAHVTELSCLERKSVLQAHESYCIWSENALKESVCSYREPKFTYLTIAYVSVIVSIVTTLINSPIDILFERLTAPTADSVKLNATDTVLRRVRKRAVAGARRVSMAAMNAINQVGNLMLSSEERKKLSRSANYETIELPESTRLAQQVALATTSSVSARSQEILLHRAAAKFEKMSLLRTFKSKQRAFVAEDSDHEDFADYQSSADSSVDEAEDSKDETPKRKHKSGAANDRDRESDSSSDDEQERPKKFGFNGRTSILSRMLGYSDKEAMKQFLALSEEIDLQRRYVPSNEVDSFDAAWGIDPTGEFVKRDVLTWTGFHHVDAALNIKNEIALVNKESSRMSEDLKVATDEHIGVALLHLFILDVLGRQTAAARIFESKAAEDFNRIRVVTRTNKMLSWLAVILMNLIFITFTVLRAYQRGDSWQRAFVLGCVIQILVEVLFNETIEVVWVHLLVPASVHGQVVGVAEKMKAAIQQLCSVATKDSRYFLDAPSYFFVSVAVAKKFPGLLESMVIRTYQSHVPGMLSNKWRYGAMQRLDRNYGVRTVSLTAAVLSGLQVMAASPFIIQRVFIRILQPWMLQGIMIVFAYLGQNAVALSLTCVGLALLAAGLIYYTFYAGRANAKNRSVVDSSNDGDSEEPGSGVDREEEASANAVGVEHTGERDEDTISDDETKDNTEIAMAVSKRTLHTLIATAGGSGDGVIEGDDDADNSTSASSGYGGVIELPSEGEEGPDNIESAGFAHYREDVGSASEQTNSMRGARADSWSQSEDISVRVGIVTSNKLRHRQQSQKLSSAGLESADESNDHPCSRSISVGSDRVSGNESSGSSSSSTTSTSSSNGSSNSSSSSQSSSSGQSDTETDKSFAVDVSSRSSSSGDSEASSYNVHS